MKGLHPKEPYPVGRRRRLNVQKRHYNVGALAIEAETICLKDVMCLPGIFKILKIDIWAFLRVLEDPEKNT